MSIPIVASEAEFARAVAAPGPTIVEFTGPNCIICRKLKPMLEAVAAQAPVSIVEADASRLPALAERFAIRSVPTLVLFRAGEAAGRKVGFSTAAELRRWVEGDGAASGSHTAEESRAP